MQRGKKRNQPNCQPNSSNGNVATCRLPLRHSVNPLAKPHRVTPLLGVRCRLAKGQATFVDVYNAGLSRRVFRRAGDESPPSPRPSRPTVGDAGKPPSLALCWNRNSLPRAGGPARVRRFRSASDYGAYSIGALIPLTCFSSVSRLQSPGFWLGGNSFRLIKNLLAIPCRGTSTKARSIIQSW